MARIALKPIGEQVVVIMGASSGIGRQTALQFARRGAKLVVAARGEAKLTSLVEQIRQTGGTATSIVADVTDVEQVKAVADVPLLYTDGWTRGCMWRRSWCTPASKTPRPPNGSV
jgi:NADP-dependent 3-hydroxy acid dehydrogenase YdfG